MGWFMVEEWRSYRAGQRLRHQASMAGERAHIYEVRRRAFDSQGIPDYRTCEWHGEAENGDGRQELDARVI